MQYAALGYNLRDGWIRSEGAVLSVSKGWLLNIFSHLESNLRDVVLRLVLDQIPKG
jgi:hypothetical protein